MSQFHHRVLVTGSRDWTNEEAIRNGMLVAVSALAWETADWYASGETFALVSGACPTGADAMAERFAAKRGWEIERYPADWDAHGKAAGFIRNREMVDSKPELVIAFQKNASKGTGHTIDLARDARIPVFLWSE